MKVHLALNKKPLDTYTLARVENACTVNTTSMASKALIEEEAERKKEAKIFSGLTVTRGGIVYYAVLIYTHEVGK